MTVELATQWDVWAKRWSLLGQPMRPTPQDVAFYEQSVARAADGIARPHVTMLGVTPEIATMSWPTGTLLTAIDHSRGMIEGVWPRRELRVEGRALEAEWSNLPLDDRSQHVVIGDGSDNQLATIDLQNVVSREIWRVLKPAGTLILRLFVPSEPETDLADAVRDLVAGRFAHFQAFKLLLLTGLPRDVEESIALADVWTAWDRMKLDRDRLAATLGWSRESIDTIDIYRNNRDRYRFPTAPQTIARLRPLFDLVQLATHDYPLAANCPTLVLRKNG